MGYIPSPCDEFIRLSDRSVSVGIVEYQRLRDLEGTEMYFHDGFTTWDSQDMAPTLGNGLALSLWPTASLGMTKQGDSFSSSSSEKATHVVEYGGPYL